MEVPMRKLIRNDGERLITVTLVTEDNKRMTLEKTLGKGDTLSFPEALADTVIVVVL